MILVPSFSCRVGAWSLASPLLVLAVLSGAPAEGQVASIAISKTVGLNAGDRLASEWSLSTGVICQTWRKGRRSLVSRTALNDAIFQ